MVPYSTLARADSITVRTCMYESPVLATCLTYVFPIHPCSHIATSGQFRGLILDLQVVGGDDTKGYIEATVLLRNGSVITGPICGTVNGITATFACYSKGLLSSSAQGTVDSIG